MPSILTRKFSNEIAKNITYNNNVIINNVSKSNHINRRQEGIKKNTGDDQVQPTPVSSIPTITIESGSIFYTLTSITPISISPLSIAPLVTNTNNTINTTVTPTSAVNISSSSIPGTGTISTDTSTSETTPTDTPTDTPTPEVPTITTTFVPVQTQIPLSSIFRSTSSTSSPQPIPSSISSDHVASNHLNGLIISLLAISISLIVLILLGLIYRKRKRSRNTNTLQNINAGEITDKEKENSSKSNSLTSSINSISSSFKIKKGKIVPGDINVGIPPLPPPVIIDNKDDEEKPQMPVLKRTPTTVSAFQELVDLTDYENLNLRKSVSSGIYTIASRLSSTPTYVNYDAEEGSSSNAINVVPLQQERINTTIPYSGAGIGSSNTNNDDNDNDDKI